MLVVLRSIERNPLRAHLVERAEPWPWSSLAAAATAGPHLGPGPVPRVADWVAAVNAPMFQTEIEAIRSSMRWDAPFGSEPWVLRTAAALGLESSSGTEATPG